MGIHINTKKRGFDSIIVGNAFLRQLKLSSNRLDTHTYIPTNIKIILTLWTNSFDSEENTNINIMIQT